MILASQNRSSGHQFSSAVVDRHRVLVVEDEVDVRDLIALHLKREGLDVDVADTVESAWSMLESRSYALVVLDWMLPGASGVELARRLRATATSLSAEAAILMVTARAEASDIVQGLEAGADDYVTKPFEPAVLLARVRALLRRVQSLSPAPSEASEAGETLRLGSLTIDPNAYEVRCGEEPISLTPSEFKLLLALAHSRGRVLTRDSLIGQVQGEGVSVVGRTVDTHVFGLRKKLGACADVIETVRGVGYRVRGSEASPSGDSV